MDIERLKELKGWVNDLRKFGVSEGNEVITILDEAIARQSVKSEEVAEAIGDLLDMKEHWCADSTDNDAISIDLAIAALQAYQPWIPVSNIKPETDKNVFLTVKRKSYFSDETIYKVIIGCYFAPYEYEAENWNDYDTDFCDYHEESDTYYIKEGWYECAMFGDDYSYFSIDDGWEVTHWKPTIPPKGE